MRRWWWAMAESAGAESAGAESAGSGAPARGRGVREVLVVLVVAAVLLWGSSRLTWVTATTVDDLRGTRTVAFDGSTWAGELVPLALAALAAVAAVLAVRGWAVRVVATLVALIGVAAAVPAVRLLLSGAQPGRTAALLERSSGQVSTTTSAAGAVLALCGGVLLVISGAVLVRTAGRAAGLSDRYDTPSVRRERATSADLAELDSDLAERRIWDALDAGKDPTAGPGAGRALDPTGDPRHRPASLGPDPRSDRGEGDQGQ